jgi:hypothetical protein
MQDFFSGCSPSNEGIPRFRGCLLISEFASSIKLKKKKEKGRKGLRIQNQRLESKLSA